MCVDGSAMRHPIRELPRASYAWIFLGEGTDETIATARGVVLDVLPQTSQASEHQGMALLPMFQERGGTRYGDCMTVINMCNSSAAHQVSRKHRYAGLRRGAMMHDIEGHTASVCHTPAHRDRAEIDMLPVAEKRIGIGNWNADAQASSP